MQHQWADTSRSGSIRTYKVYGDAIKVRCDEVSSYDFSDGPDGKAISVDPTDGPKFYVGQVLENDGHTWTIKSIMNHLMSNSTAVFVFGV
jgi:hypothetical protein